MYARLLPAQLMMLKTFVQVDIVGAFLLVGGVGLFLAALHAGGESVSTYYRDHVVYLTLRRENGHQLGSSLAWYKVISSRALHC